MKKMISFLKNPYAAITIIISCIFLFKIGADMSFSQKFINKIFPCEQNPANSLPCNGEYDIYLMIIVSTIGILFLGILFFNLFKFFKSKN